MQRKFFQWIPLIIIMFVVNGYCAANSCDRNNDIYEQGHAATKDQMTGGYNNPARIDVQGAWDFFVTGNFIYWQPRQDGLEFARYQKNSIVEGGRILKFDLVEIDFNYHPGFKVGLGTNFDRDDWFLFIEYTRLYTKESDKKILPLETFNEWIERLIPFWGPTYPDPAFAEKATWKLHYNILDGVVGRSCYVGTKLILKPYVGIRGGWIHQKFSNTIVSRFTRIPDFFPYHIFSKNKSQSWLVGPRVGMDTNWLLGGGFRFFGNAAASLFYQRINTKITLNQPQQVILEHEEEQTIPFTYWFLKKEKGFINPNAEINAGFGWGNYFYDDSWHIDIAVSYEFHIFWRQNMMRKIVDYIGNQANPTAGILTLNGCTVSLKLDF